MRNRQSGAFIWISFVIVIQVLVVVVCLSSMFSSKGNDQQASSFFRMAPVRADWSSTFCNFEGRHNHLIGSGSFCNNSADHNDCICFVPGMKGFILLLFVCCYCSC